MAYRITDFFDVVLKGESKTYDDHNWYVTGNILKGYIKGRNNDRYSLLKKDLSEYTIGEIINFQSRQRDNIGQLWATGRYQIIPSTLKDIKEKMNLPDSTKYNRDVQDKMGMFLLRQRKNIRDYLDGNVPDNKTTVENAALEVAKIWSSVGVPYAMQGKHRQIEKNESYYSGGGDKASVSTELIQVGLRNLRNSLRGGMPDSGQPIKTTQKHNSLLLVSLITFMVGTVFISVYLTKKYSR